MEPESQWNRKKLEPHQHVHCAGYLLENGVSNFASFFCFAKHETKRNKKVV
jgi:hypothetical protein